LADFKPESPQLELPLFWTKVRFSVLLGLPAIYVVLRETHAQRTQDWALNVLSVITGVWIGTVA